MRQSGRGPDSQQPASRVPRRAGQHARELVRRRAAWTLAALAVALVVAAVTALAYGWTSKELFIGIAVLLAAYLFFFLRQVVQEKNKIQWRAPPVPKDATGAEDTEVAVASG